MARYAQTASPPPDHLVARRRSSLPHGRRGGEHVEIRSAPRAHLRRARQI